MKAIPVCPGQSVFDKQRVNSYNLEKLIGRGAGLFWQASRPGAAGKRKTRKAKIQEGFMLKISFQMILDELEQERPEPQFELGTIFSSPAYSCTSVG